MDGGGAAHQLALTQLPQHLLLLLIRQPTETLSHVFEKPLGIIRCRLLHCVDELFLVCCIPLLGRLRGGAAFCRQAVLWMLWVLWLSCCAGLIPVDLSM